MKFNIFSTFTLVLGHCYHGSGFLADPDPDSEKSLIRIREKKTDPKHCFWVWFLSRSKLGSVYLSTK